MSDTLSELLTSKEFLEKAFLLMIGAALTGLLVPVVKARLDESGARRKTLLEAELARQTALIDSQIKLLNQFSDAAWKFLFTVFRVSYTQAWEDEKAQRAAIDEYDPRSWELLMQMRATISQEQLMQTYQWRTRESARNIGTPAVPYDNEDLRI